MKILRRLRSSKDNTLRDVETKAESIRYEFTNGSQIHVSFEENRPGEEVLRIAGLNCRIVIRPNSINNIVIAAERGA